MGIVTNNNLDIKSSVFNDLTPSKLLEKVNVK
jgi:hypothetical protein